MIRQRAENYPRQLQKAKAKVEVEVETKAKVEVKAKMGFVLLVPVIISIKSITQNL